MNEKKVSRSCPCGTKRKKLFFLRILLFFSSSLVVLSFIFKKEKEAYFCILTCQATVLRIFGETCYLFNRIKKGKKRWDQYKFKHNIMVYYGILLDALVEREEEGRKNC